MYTNEDLNKAVEKGIFTASAVSAFRADHALNAPISRVDEENFRLITGFNDIFVVIACSLLLFSSLWVVKSSSLALALVVFTLLAWGLAEFFVRKKRMALPAIVLLLSFIGGIYSLSMQLFESQSTEAQIIIATCVAALASYLHWRRFNVPITIAVGTGAAMLLVAALLIATFPVLEDWLLIAFFIAGIIAFSHAMYWDASDLERTTYRADVAFWLHLLAAPLIIHPIFTGLGILDGNESISSAVIVIALYIVMMLISMAVDRRAFMVSALIYVIYAFSNLLETYGIVSYSFALTGVFIGAMLLLLSAFWHTLRRYVMTLLPSVITRYTPAGS